MMKGIKKPVINGGHLSPPQSEMLNTANIQCFLRNAKERRRKNKVHSKNRGVHLIIYIKERNQNQNSTQK